MKRFFEDSSQAKMLTPELSYRYGIKHMKNTAPVEYELRDYSRRSVGRDYALVDSFVTKGGALLAKSFAEFETGMFTYAVVAVTPDYMRGGVENDVS